MSDADKGIFWEQCRGIESIDLNDNLILVQAPIEQVAQSFKQVRQVARWERDVYGREIEILGCTFAVFQLRGHSWTVLHQLTFLHKQVPLGEKDIQLLSGLLHTKAIYYLVSDTSGYIRHLRKLIMRYLKPLVERRLIASLRLFRRCLLFIGDV